MSSVPLCVLVLLAFCSTVYVFQAIEMELFRVCRSKDVVRTVDSPADLLYSMNMIRKIG